MKKFILIPLILIILSGCWSRKELNDLSIVTGLGVDVVDKGYELTVQIINPAEVAAKVRTTRTSVSTYSAQGKTMFEALRNLIEHTPKRVYLSHTRVVILSEELVSQGIKEVLDFLIRDHEIRTDFYLAISKDNTAKNLLNVLTPLERIPASKIYSSIETNEKYLAQTRSIKIQELISDILLKGKHPFMTGIMLNGNSDFGSKMENVEQINSPARIKIDHIGVLYQDKLVGWLTKEESKGFNYLTGKVKNTTEVIMCDEDHLTFEIIKSDTKMKGKVNQGTPEFEMEIKVDANIAEDQCNSKITKLNVLKELEDKLSKEIKQLSEAALEALQEDLQSDIVGFGEYLNRTQHKEWKKIEEQWDDIFPGVRVEINVKAKIKQTGTITESIQ